MNSQSTPKESTKGHKKGKINKNKYIGKYLSKNADSASFQNIESPSDSIV